MSHPASAAIEAACESPPPGQPLPVCDDKPSVVIPTAGDGRRALRRGGR